MKQPLPKPLICVIDDAPSSLKALSDLLKAEKYRVRSFDNGRQALQSIPRLKPDLILLDVQMPDMDGFDVIRQIKNSESIKNIPVIFITALNEREHEEKGLALGAADFILKPINIQAVKLRVSLQLQLKFYQDRLHQTVKDLIAANAAKDKLFSIIAHDLKNPIHGMEKMLTTAIQHLGECDKERVMEILAELHSTASATSSLLYNLLQWAKMQINAIRYSPMSQPLSGFLKKIVEMLMPEAKLKGVTISSQIPSDLSAYFDLQMTEIIVRNLLSNAIKYTIKGGSISIKAQPVHSTGSDGKIEIVVADTGIGIDEHRLTTIFQLGKITPLPGTEMEQGSGLGLILCKELVELQGGILTIDSTFGKETVASFTLSAYQDE